MKPLAEYKRKRDFKKTAEPAGSRRKKGKSEGLIFVVQEHHASHLHYDFRLEWGGVLKSWAVPKGPSMDPAQKRLAVEVEDHPLDYASFTGKIPKGEYGGGEVFRWDSGTWEPKGDAAASLKKGRLEFTLEGKKLSGAWILVRTKREATKPNWLLMKRRDAGAKATPSAASRPERSDASPTAFVKPQLAQLVARPPEGGDWVHEIKFDGYRLQAHLGAGKPKLYTRNGHDWTGKYPALARILGKPKLAGAVLDGELVWQSEGGQSDFGALQRAMKSGETADLVYWVFDLLALGGKDLKSLPLAARKDRLRKLVPSFRDERVRFSDHFREPGDQMLVASCQMHLEGIVSKRVDAPYSPGRRDTWTKAKCTKRQEFVIGGFTAPAGARRGFGALLLGVNEGAGLRYAGRVGTGFDADLLRDIAASLRKLVITESPFDLASPKGSGIRFVRPTLVAEVSFAEWTSEGVLRHAVFHGLRADKPAAEIEVEEEKPVPRMKPPVRTRSAPTKNAAAPNIAAPPKVSHPDRVIYVREKITKRMVAEYYRDVAPFLLPHVAGRPLSLVRCPKTSTDKTFYSKHFPGKMPDHVEAIANSGEADFFTIENEEGLNALVQFGTLEIHPWNCHRPDIEKPDQIVMDFDPDKSVAFQSVKEGALELRAMLKDLGLESFVKLTGGKGVHVHVPFVPRHDWPTIKNLAKSLAQEMVSRHPGSYTANATLKARKNKIYLDWLRNGRGATAIAPYALRARAKSAVAMPISWAELDDVASGDLFTIERAISYLKKRRKDPWAGYARKQELGFLP